MRAHQPARPAPVDGGAEQRERGEEVRPRSAQQGEQSSRDRVPQAQENGVVQHQPQQPQQNEQ